MRGVYPLSLVDNPHDHSVLTSAGYYFQSLDRYITARGHSFDRVLEEVYEELNKLSTITKYGWEVWCAGQRYGHSLFRCRGGMQGNDIL